jgi:hypothetical protein
MDNDGVLGGCNWTEKHISSFESFHDPPSVVCTYNVHREELEEEWNNIALSQKALPPPPIF